ncbi:hypothetical protein BU17DRAFT_61898 [Hysterangium stoloniferum]|nr:hypothetical protein BU17DRAFT_61898 [Hysterangium stoloniferum]
MPAIIPIDNTWGKGYFLCYSTAQRRWLLLTTGAVFIGVLVGVLYGILTLQMYSYYQKFPKDPSHLKCLVGVIWVLDTLHTIFVTHMVYTYLVTNFGDYLALGHNIWSFNLLTRYHIAARFSDSVFHPPMLEARQRDIQHLFVGNYSVVRTCPNCVRTDMYRPHNSTSFTLTEFTQFLKYTCRNRAFALEIEDGNSTNQQFDNELDCVDSKYWYSNQFTASTDTLIHDFFNVMLAKLYANTLLATLNHRRAAGGPDDSEVQNISLTAVNRSRGSHSRNGDTKWRRHNPAIDAAIVMPFVPVTFCHAIQLVAEPEEAALKTIL